jgi:hypothetical protein
MALIAKHSEDGFLSSSQIKRRMLVLACGLAFMLTVMPFTPRFDPLLPQSIQTQQTVQSIELAIDTSCSPFGSLLGCADLAPSTADSAH